MTETVPAVADWRGRGTRAADSSPMIRFGRWSVLPASIPGRYHTGMTRAAKILPTRGCPPRHDGRHSHPTKLLSGSRLDIVGPASQPSRDTASSLRAQRTPSPRSILPGLIGRRARAAADRTHPLADASSLTAAEAARLIPPMLGLNGRVGTSWPSRTPAEARATGGLLDAFAIVTADGGRVRSNVSAPTPSCPR
jgi:hypothetical protein